MIAAITYTCTGSEPLDVWGMIDDVQVDGTLVMINAASGYEIIDVRLNGYSQDYQDLLVDETKGRIVFSPVLVKGDVVEALYKTLPRYGTLTTMVDFDPADFTSGDFA
jgi:hypothetical protein